MEKQRSEEAEKQKSVRRSREAKNYKSREAGKSRKAKSREAKKQGHRNPKKVSKRETKIIPEKNSHPFTIGYTGSPPIWDAKWPPLLWVGYWDGLRATRWIRASILEL